MPYYAWLGIWIMFMIIVGQALGIMRLEAEVKSLREIVQRYRTRNIGRKTGKQDQDAER